MHKFGVPCPEPVGLYGHVLVMEFIGASGLPAPILKVYMLFFFLLAHNFVGR